MKDHN